MTAFGTGLGKLGFHCSSELINSLIIRVLVDLRWEGASAKRVQICEVLSHFRGIDMLD
ncbi:hypothetical protein F2S75_03705 [Pseudomonas syringae pv. actinidiae]|nr:hypothetical protein [Pseudomonas syringae pv. actinidiae]